MSNSNHQLLHRTRTVCSTLFRRAVMSEILMIPSSILSYPAWAARWTCRRVFVPQAQTLSPSCPPSVVSPGSPTSTSHNIAGRRAIPRNPPPAPPRGPDPTLPPGYSLLAVSRPDESRQRLAHQPRRVSLVSLDRLSSILGGYGQLQRLITIFLYTQSHYVLPCSRQ